jgi:hypothetical protein
MFEMKKAGWIIPYDRTDICRGWKRSCFLGFRFIKRNRDIGGFMKHFAEGEDILYHNQSPCEGKITISD